MNARVVSLQLRRQRDASPAPVASVTGRIGGGIEGDFHVAKATRSVLVVDRSTLDDLGLAPGALREQITIEGVRDVTSLEPGTLLRIGGITMQVNGPCEPCTHIGELNQVADPEGFRLSLVGRRGAVCTVVTADSVARVGDPVEVLAPAVAG
jgi:MOSC domain-containing protein YiiM